MFLKSSEQIIGGNWPIYLVISSILAFLIIKFLLFKPSSSKSEKSLIRSVLLNVFGLLSLIAIVLAIPIGIELQKEILKLIGIIISAVFALSSATLFGNGLAGIMLRMINNYKTGDFIEIDKVLGRVTQRRLFHTEVQTETRDLITLPNMYLITNPVRVVRSSGTFIEGVVSLGYDVNQKLIKKALIKAAKRAELEEPFVRVSELGDFSVVYKVYGLLKNAKTIITAQSKLNSCMLDTLHEAGIEIVSPNFTNRKEVDQTIFIPEKVFIEVKEEENVESLIFDKADQAESLEKQKESLADINQKIKDVKAAIHHSLNDEEISSLNLKAEKLNNIRERLEVNINKKEVKIKEN